MLLKNDQYIPLYLRYWRLHETWNYQWYTASRKWVTLKYVKCRRSACGHYRSMLINEITFLPIWLRKNFAYASISSTGRFFMQIVFVLPFKYIPRRKGCTARFSSVLICSSGLFEAIATRLVLIQSLTPFDDPSRSLYLTTNSFSCLTPCSDMLSKYTQNATIDTGGYSFNS